MMSTGTYLATKRRFADELPHPFSGRRWGLWLALPFLATLVWAVQGGVQAPKLDTTDTQVALKGQYLFQFAKGNDWPETAKSGPFVVAVHGKPALVEELASKYATHLIGSQPLTVISFELGGDQASPQVLYTEATGPELEAVLRASEGSPTLVVTAMQPTMPNQKSAN